MQGNGSADPARILGLPPPGPPRNLTLNWLHVEKMHTCAEGVTSLLKNMREKHAQEAARGDFRQKHYHGAPKSIEGLRNDSRRFT